MKALKIILIIFFLSVMAGGMSNTDVKTEIVNLGGYPLFLVYATDQDSNEINQSAWINTSIFLTDGLPLLTYHTKFDGSGADSLAFLKIDGGYPNVITGAIEIDSSLVTLTTNDPTFYNDTVLQVDGTLLSPTRYPPYLRVRWGVKDLDSGSCFDGVLSFWLQPLELNNTIVENYFERYYPESIKP